MSAWGWGLLGIIYLVLLFTLAIMTFRKGHWVLGLIGFIFPILWIIGAVLPGRRRCLASSRTVEPRTSESRLSRATDAAPLCSSPVQPGRPE